MPTNFGEQDSYDLSRFPEHIGGLNRREFLKFCTGIAATLGLFGTTAVMRIAEAATAPQRPPVIWLSGQECTGCSESLLRANHPTLEQLILEIISLDYHETLSIAAGHQLEAARRASMEANKGHYILVVEGAIPTKDGGIYCKIANKTIHDHVVETAEHAAAIVAMGSCASWGGVQATPPNPTGAVGIPTILKGKTVITIPGCPPNPYNILATILHLVTFKRPPELDAQGRPVFAYGRLIHENCERRPHFDAGRFAIEFGDAGHRAGHCLYKLGCKGPETYANCPVARFGDVGSASWPVATGHPCIGCTEKGIVFEKSIHALATVKSLEPPTAYPRITEERGNGVSPTAAGLVGAAVGTVIGAGAMVAAKVGGQPGEKAHKNKESQHESA